MKSISATYLRNNVADVLDEVRFNRTVIIIERHGKPVAKLIPMEAGKKDGKRSIPGQPLD